MICFITCRLSGYDGSNLQYQFTRKDSSYQFTGSFKVPADPECLFEMAYNIEHLRILAGDAESVKLIRQGDQWYEVEYIYRRYWLFENRSVWHRELDRRDGMIRFELVESTNNSELMPVMLSSEGHYKFTPVDGVYHVEYFQECILQSGGLLNKYMDKARQEAISFLVNFQKQINMHCLTSL